MTYPLHTILENERYKATCQYIEDIHAWHFKISGRITKEFTELTNEWIMKQLDEENISEKRAINLIIDVRDVIRIALKGGGGIDSSQRLFSDRRFYWFVLIEPEHMMLQVSARLLSKVASVGMRYNNVSSFEEARSFLISDRNPFRDEVTGSE